MEYSHITLINGSIEIFDEWQNKIAVINPQGVIKYFVDERTVSKSERKFIQKCSDIRRTGCVKSDGEDKLYRYIDGLNDDEFISLLRILSANNTDKYSLYDLKGMI